MDDDPARAERIVTEPTQGPIAHHHGTEESVSQGVPSNIDTAPVDAEGEAGVSETSSVSPADPYAEQVGNVVNSEIGIQTLLNRLKQSIASAREFASFLKRRSLLEEEHANGLRKICRATHESLRRPEHRQGGSFAPSCDELMRIHERMADNGGQFAASLHQMQEDLLEVANNIEQGRKHWKHVGLAAEQRLVDTETAMRKSKAKYDAVADDYDRARTGDRQSVKKFGLKGPKSAAQYEEELHRKVQAADGDYQAKVQLAQSTRSEHLTKGRPEAVRSIQGLINECDSALTLQMQKFATFTEKLLLHNGLIISPIKGQGNEQGQDIRSLREVVAAIDNGKDLNSFIASYNPSVPPRQPEIRYERHPVLNTGYAVGTGLPTAQVQRPSEPMQGYNFRPGGPSAVHPPAPQSGLPPAGASVGYPPSAPAQPYAPYRHERNFSQGSPVQPSYDSMGPAGRNGPAQGYNPAPSTNHMPPQLSALPFQGSPPQAQSYPPVASHPQQAAVPIRSANLPPTKPVFGLTLEQLFERDGSAVPMVVAQCIQAVDLFGLEVEGIYRLSGTSSHVNQIKAMFDHDASKVDFRNPENFFHDVNSVAGLLKQFFRELPNPLLTIEHYQGFIEAAKNDDDIVRRDSLHAIINSLPDPNYATLRALTLHLNRVQQNASINRMNGSNLAVVFGPTLMGNKTGSDIQDAGWQVRVIDTILSNTYQIFDDD